MLNPRLQTRDHSPPATPSQRLLDAEPSHVQFASYPETPEEKTKPLMEEDEELPRGWVPPPLRGWYAISLIVVLLCLAIALEIALHFTKKNNGEPFLRSSLRQLCVDPQAIVALWAWTDIEIKKMQSPARLYPNKQFCSVDGSCTEPALGGHRRISDGAVDAVLPASGFCPAVSKEHMDCFFLTASGYASASQGYTLQQPPFILGAYTVAPFQIPTNIATNGTVFANTTAIRSDTNCVSTPVNMVNHTDGSGWTNSLSHQGCTLSWDVDHLAETLFGTSTPDCGDSTPPQFQPVVFWFFTYVPTAKSSATICYPNITLWDAAVTLDLGSGNLTSVHELRPFNANTSPFGSLSGNVTGAPLNGRAYNGINFTLQAPDKFVIARMNATQLTMPAAVFQAAVQSPQGVEGSFDADLFVNLSDQVYRTYLTLIARAVYFLPNQEPITLQLKTFQQRLWMNAAAVHILTTLFILLAIAAAFVHIVHRYQRQDLNLLHEPGTIASAVSIGAQTGMGQLLARQRNTEEIQMALRDKKFRIDPYSMKIIMDGEEGYAQGVVQSPADRRRSVFASMQGRRSSRRFSRAPGSPLPRSPRTPQSASGAV
ncbi:hypothetical protein C8R44DRAFT_650649 [Mycena epipterygia]|nr:hypothetical protein C8R44DRAFT_650649 [Mycena epipterygia]